MDSTGAYIVSSVLLPLAVKGAISCYGRARCPEKIRKNIIVLPRFSGKSHLAKSLVSNKKLIVCDLDEYIVSPGVNSPELISQYQEAEEKGNRSLSAFLYKRMVGKAFDFIREESKKAKERVLYLTSDLDFAKSRVKEDAIYCLIPSAELFEEITKDLPEDKKAEIRKDREHFLARIPFEAIKTFHSWDELETLIRGKFPELQHSVA
jgi:shikimate kinase